MSSIITLLQLWLIAAVVYFWCRFHRRLRAKRYHSFFIATIFSGILFVSLMAGGIVFSGSHPEFMVDSSLLGWMLVAYILARSLPYRRQRRRSGRRRSLVPYRLLGYLTITGGFVALIAYLAGFLHAGVAGPLGVLPIFGYGVYLLALGRRLRAAPEVLPATQRHAPHVDSRSIDRPTTRAELPYGALLARLRPNCPQWASSSVC